MKSLKLLHFADAHIDMANYGRHDPATGLPIRVVDYLKSLDQIVDRALSERVDLVIFAGDAYKDRNPQPTFQREWGQRIMRLSQAGIPTVLLVGNHDVARATHRAHTLEEYRTLSVPHVHVADRIGLLTAEELGIPIQILSIPWVSRSQLMTRSEVAGMKINDILTEIETRITDVVRNLIDAADPDIPLIVTAHASVEGATFGSERQVMLGHEVTLGQGLVRDKRIDYVALGHIHKHQNLNPNRQPPIIYPGSIERIDFGEIRERKGYVLAEVSKGNTEWEFVPLETRRFLDYTPDTPDQDSFMEDILRQLPEPDEVAEAICRVTLAYPLEWEPLLDEKAIDQRFEQALSYQLRKERQRAKKARLGSTLEVEQMGPLELLQTYWNTQGVEAEDKAALVEMAKEILGESIKELEGE